MCPHESSKAPTRLGTPYCGQCTDILFHNEDRDSVIKTQTQIAIFPHSCFTIYTKRACQPYLLLPPSLFLKEKSWLLILLLKSTRIYGTLCGSTSSSRGEFWPLAEAFLPFRQKGSLFCCVGPF